ncbi:hypothetical protein QBC33DRAFT_576756 [Phialemonium atrogriseum]|uniref:Aminoglycoside phosphotransferase domain-containing protein n=1 Tax=Phialemonium atrogriseum TaxID=1093897 RepID=A0AAJ0C445_9PEZI|nr:uncharacterized protein QBC33DRAFT_576756 [Phialemonium atrogriseum]KAK1769600.1 hypothetical protein QBC33DRAFT_576756 [Phialemonium atrogriseum]
MGDDRADFDNVAWDRNDEAWEESQKWFRRVCTLRKIEAFVTQKLGKTATWVTPLRIGGFNNLYRLRIEGPNQAHFVAQNTRIPVAQVLFYGLSSPESEVGPFLIIKHVENCGTMSHALAMPNEKDPTEAHMLNPGVSEGVVERFYGKAAVHLLQLFEPSFPCIGSLAQTDENTFLVAGRPITQNMNNMLQLANIPRATLPPGDRIYRTADEWYLALAEMHMAQLIFQHNDLVTSTDDCQNKYVARQLFLRLAKQGRLSTFGFNQPSTLSAPSGSSSFRLWCDDLRPSNILLNEAEEIVAVIDWEFSYVAPTQFSLDPPWWLLLNVPETWHTDIDDWTKVYNTRLKTWLRAMEKAEESMETKSKGFTLSSYMQESWETGRFFGSREGDIAKQDLWKTRVHLLSEKERNAMGPFVERKMKDSKERILVDWDDEQVKKRLAEVLRED